MAAISPPPSGSSYTLGHHDSVTRSHTSRTATKDAAFLLPFIKPRHKILDVGCGPGTITAGFCAFAPQGEVVGVDASESVIAQAQSLATGGGELRFEVASVVAEGGLPFPDGTFDIVFTHQVLVHIPDPVKALREMRRVCRPDGGMIACREGSATSFTWTPDPSGYLARWRRAMCDMLIPTGCAPTGGEGLSRWMREAGMDPKKMRKSISVTSYSTEEERKWWGELHRERLEKSDVKTNFLSTGVTEEELEGIKEALRVWGGDVDGVFAMMQWEVIALM